MEDEKKIETPEEKVETAVPLEKEDIYGNDEFVDAKKPVRQPINIAIPV